MKITPLRMWVQNVLPVVYDDSLSYYEIVGKINEKTNEIINQVNENTDAIEALNEVIAELGDIDELKALLEEVENIIENLYTTDIPIMDSANGSAGVANHAARSDHSHPSNIPNDGSNDDVLIKGGTGGYAVKWASSPPQMGAIAVIETSPTRTAHAINDYIVYNGKLYIVTTAISAQEQLTINGNIRQVTVMSEMRKHLTFATATATVVSDMTSSAMAVYTITLKINGYDRTRIRQFIYMGMTNPAGIIPTTHSVSGSENVTCYGFATNAQSQTAGNTITVKFLYEQ